MKSRILSIAAMGRAVALTVLFSVVTSAPALAGPGGSPDAVFATADITLQRNERCVNNGSGSFSCSDVSSDTFTSFGVALGDVDGVGGLDAVFANAGSLRNRVCLNDGSGLSGNFTCGDVSTDGNNSRDVALGDVDGVNGLDAVFANDTGANSVNRVCLNDGAGNFTCSNVSTDSGRTTRGVALGDVDGVNGLDAVFANDGGLRNRVCLNDGSGNFTCGDVSTDTNESWGVALIDVDGVNGLDAIFANRDQRNRVCLNNGSGSFTCGDVSTDTNSSREVALAEVDGVNGPDAVFANRNQRDRVCLNNGSGSFTCGDVSTHLGETHDVALGDMDGDADQDIVFANGADSPNGDRNRVCLNDGSGSFTCSDMVSTFRKSNGVALGDLTPEADPSIPALSIRGSLIALLLLFVGVAVAGLSRRRSRRVA